MTKETITGLENVKTFAQERKEIYFGVRRGRREHTYESIFGTIGAIPSCGAGYVLGDLLVELSQGMSIEKLNEYGKFVMNYPEINEYMLMAIGGALGIGAFGFVGNKIGGLVDRIVAKKRLANLGLEKHTKRENYSVPIEISSDGKTLI